MTMHARDRNAVSPEDCRWRAGEPDGPGEVARCRLLHQLFGPGKEDACTVTREVCVACCGSFPPTFESLNPVVASLVFDRAGAFAKGDPEGQPDTECDALRAWAEQHLEIEAPPLPRREPVKRSPRQLALPLDEAIPPPQLRCGEPVRHWAVGVTTAPRRRPHLGECLRSLAFAGWPRPHLFIDGSIATPSDWSHLPATSRDQQIGAWPNYYLSLIELLMREPLADAFLMVQDDALFVAREDVRQYLERILWPGDTLGIVSLYCATPDARREAGWSKYRGRWKYGAVAFVFPREVARQLVISPPVFEHRWIDARKGLVGIPEVIAAWAESTGTPMYFPTPSLIQHVGETSAIWLGAFDLTPERQAGICLDEPCDNLAVLPDRPAPCHVAEFPEHLFPCSEEVQADYDQRVMRGRGRMSAATAVICGLCRDLALQLPATIARVEYLASMFRDCDMVIFENDSQDATVDVLRQWAAANPAVHLLSERLKQPKLNFGTSRDRTERMAYYRNRCREAVVHEFGGRDFVVVADMDLEGWSYDGIASTFGYQDWDFVGSNGLCFASAAETRDGGTGVHADSFAYRAVGQTQLMAAEAHRLRFRRGEPLVPVWSCFGGLGIYHMPCFRAASYEGHDCEHVTYHEAMRERGHDRLFLNPSQIVLYSPWRASP